MNKALSVISNLLRMSGLLVSEANAENTMLVYGTWQPVALTFRKLGYSKDYQNADLTVVKKLDSVMRICNIKDTVTVVTDYSNQVTEFHSCFTSIVHSLVAHTDTEISRILIHPNSLLDAITSLSNYYYLTKTQNIDSRNASVLDLSKGSASYVRVKRINTSEQNCLLSISIPSLKMKCRIK
jgi:hypothetical protein